MSKYFTCDADLNRIGSMGQHGDTWGSMAWGSMGTQAAMGQHGDTGFFRGGGVAYGIAVWSNFLHKKPSQLPEKLLSGESLWDAYREPKSSSLARSQFATFLLG